MRNRIFYSNSIKKPRFIPDTLPNGKTIGISFEKYGLVFLYVGKVELKDRTVPAMVISDWSLDWRKEDGSSQFIRSVTTHNKASIGVDAFIQVEDDLVYGTSNNPRHPLYALTDPHDILNLIEQIRKTDEDLPKTLLTLEETLKTSLQRGID